VKTEASKNPEIAEGIALQDPCDDEFLKDFLPTVQFFFVFTFFIGWIHPRPRVGLSFVGYGI